MGKMSSSGDFSIIFKPVVTCSECGKMLTRTLEAEGTEVICPKCGAKLLYSVHENRVITILEQPSPKRRRHLSKYLSLTEKAM